MLVGNNIYTKFFSPLIKILCIITIIFSYSNISLSALQTISFTPILFFFGMVLFRWYQFLFSTKKVFYGIILDFLFSVVIILFIIFGYTIIYLNFIIIILDILFNLIFVNVKETKNSLLNYQDPIIIFEFLFICLFLAHFFDYSNSIYFIIMWIILSFSQLFQVISIFHLGKVYSNKRYEKLKIRKWLSFVFTLFSLIPLMFAINFDEGRYFLGIEYIIYYGIICIYPLIMCRLFKMALIYPKITDKKISNKQ